MQRIHLLWDGPHTYREVREKADVAIDYGIYQVYGPHPASGRNSLLYIGKANDETFGARFSQADRLAWNDPFADNAGLLRFFTGRIHPTEGEPQDVIDEELWGRYIDLAERLLIAAHSPPWNAQGVGGIRNKDAADYDDCHVLNWGTYASLMPEVSGMRHSWAEYGRLGDEPLRSEAEN